MCVGFLAFIAPWFQVIGILLVCIAPSISLLLLICLCDICVSTVLQLNGRRSKFSKSGMPDNAKQQTLFIYLIILYETCLTETYLLLLTPCYCTFPNEGSTILASYAYLLQTCMILVIYMSWCIIFKMPVYGHTLLGFLLNVN